MCNARACHRPELGTRAVAGPASLLLGLLALPSVSVPPQECVRDLSNPAWAPDLIAPLVKPQGYKECVGARRRVPRLGTIDIWAVHSVFCGAVLGTVGYWAASAAPPTQWQRHHHSQSRRSRIFPEFSVPWGHHHSLVRSPGWSKGPPSFPSSGHGVSRWQNSQQEVPKVCFCSGGKPFCSSA